MAPCAQPHRWLLSHIQDSHPSLQRPLCPLPSWVGPTLWGQVSAAQVMPKIDTLRTGSVPGNTHPTPIPGLKAASSARRQAPGPQAPGWPGKGRGHSLSFAARTFLLSPLGRGQWGRGRNLPDGLPPELTGIQNQLVLTWMIWGSSVALPHIVTSLESPPPSHHLPCPAAPWEGISL